MPDTGPRFAILQRSLEIPDVDRLKHAFRSVKCLTDSDAHTLARDAFGILPGEKPQSERRHDPAGRTGGGGN